MALTIQGDKNIKQQGITITIVRAHVECNLERLLIRNGLRPTFSF